MRGLMVVAVAGAMLMAAALEAEAAVRAATVTQAGRSGAQDGASSGVSLVEAGRLVERYFNGLGTLQADFSQQTTGEAFVQEGTFTLKKPRQFLWQYETPVRQRIISTGTAVYYIDQERSQVTQLPVNAGLARFFNAADFKLAKAGAQVTGVKSTPTRLVVTLKLDGKTDGNQAGMTSVVLSFARARGPLPAGSSGLTLEEIAAVDTLDVTTTVRFSNVKTGLVVSAEMFRYTPPQYQTND